MQPAQNLQFESSKQIRAKALRSSAALLLPVPRTALLSQVKANGVERAAAAFGLSVHCFQQLERQARIEQRLYEDLRRE